MEVLKKAKIPIIICLLLFIGFFVYNTMFKKPTPDSGIERTSQSTTKNPSRDFSALLTLIKSVDFDDKFFADPTFRSLVDFSEDVQKEDKGRDNPFAPGIVSSFANTGNGLSFEEENQKNASSTPSNSSKTQSSASSTNPR